jgi:ATP-dependent phosphoenolpyruvate carboxykinase
MFDQKAAELAGKFIRNFEQYAEFASDEIKAASPQAIAAVV